MRERFIFPCHMDECYTFFEDVCTINEIQSLAQRFEVARLLRVLLPIKQVPENIQVGDGLEVFLYKKASINLACLFTRK